MSAEPKPTSTDRAAAAAAVAFVASADPPTAPVYLLELLNEIAVREGFAAGYTIDFATGSNHGDGFQALMLRTSIIGSPADIVAATGEPRRLQLISKVPPASEMRQQMSAPSFRQEVFSYDRLLPALVKLQLANGITPASGDGFFAFPKCYGTVAREESNEYAIVLEDLKHRQFRMWNKFEPIDFEHMKLILTQIGRYHALSFALRAQQPELLLELSSAQSGMYEMMIRFPAADQFYQMCFNRALGTLTDEADAALRTKTEKLRDNYLKVLRSVTLREKCEPYAVLNHGDCWNNNMMFEYDGDEGRMAKSVCVIDWQQVQYCSPATDVSYLMFSSTEHELRAQHYDDMIRVYHDSLSEFLGRLGCDAEKLFGWDVCQEHLQQFSIYAMVLAPMLIQIVTVDPKDLPDMDKIDMEHVEDFDLSGSNVSLYDKRMRDALRDFDKLGYFESKHNKND